MYRTIVAMRFRALWRRIGADEFDLAVAQAAPGMRFTFVGDIPLGTSVTGTDALRAWFRQLDELFPGIHLELQDVIVKGWPWNTTVAARLHITAELQDETAYQNHAVQWVRMRWFKMTDDWVIEDTVALAAACSVQSAARISPERKTG